LMNPLVTLEWDQGYLIEMINGTYPASI